MTADLIFFAHVCSVEQVNLNTLSLSSDALIRSYYKLGDSKTDFHAVSVRSAAVLAREKNLHSFSAIVLSRALLLKYTNGSDYVSMRSGPGSAPHDHTLETVCKILRALFLQKIVLAAILSLSAYLSAWMVFCVKTTI